MNYFNKILLFVFSLGLAFAALEISLFVYANFFIGKTKVYEFNSYTGYNFKKNLSTKKRIGDKNISFITDQFRARVSTKEEQNRKTIFPGNRPTRLIIAGDSFAEGQTDAGKRFDYIINSLTDEIQAVAIGCGGFDTVQQIRAAEPFFNDLRKDDHFILLTCGNDFGDLLRKSIFGRSKPYIELIDGKIKITNANSNFFYRIRDTSYTIAYALQFWDALNMRFVFDEQETRRSQHLYIAYIKHVFNDLISRGIRPKVAVHSLKLTSLTNELFSKLRSQNIEFINLDNFLEYEEKYLLNDKIHWNAEGNKLVARKILNFLQIN